MSDLFWLSEAQFARRAPLLPHDTRGVPRVDDRWVISGVVQVLRLILSLSKGGRWADAPPAHGPSKTLYNRFVRWAARGVWREVFEALAASGGPPSTIMLDLILSLSKGTHAKAHRCAAGGRGGPSVRPSEPREAGAPPSPASPSTSSGDPAPSS